MCLVFTVLFALVIGFCVRTRLPAVTLYVASFSIVFCFQTLVLLLAWLSGSDEAFGDAPTTFPVDYRTADVLAYGVVNLAIVLVGIGLVLLGVRIGAKRVAGRIGSR